MTKIKHFFQNKNFLTLWFIYSLLFIILATFTVGLYILLGKSFISVSDPYYQHVTAGYYLSDYVRTAISNFLDTGQLSLPMWDMSIGFGADILTTLNYYSFGDPLDILYAFFNPNHAEFVYNLLVFVRLYLCGFAFISFAYYMKNERLPILLGSVVYTFSGFAIVCATLHPFFLNAMIYFPFILLGIEKIFRKERPYLFICMITISLISNFYFAYMIVIFAFIYALLRYFFFFKQKNWRHFLAILGKFIGFFVIGFLIAGIIFIPVLITFLGNGRDEMGAGANLFTYPLTYYFEVFQNIFSPNSGGTASIYWSNLSLPVIGFFSAIICFIKGKDRLLKIFFILSCVILFVPFFGYALNGFSYVSNRWIFAFTLLVAFLAMKALPLFTQLTAKEIRTLVIITFTYCAIIFLMNPFFNAAILITLANIFGLLVIILLTAIPNVLPEHKNFKQKLIIWASVLSIIIMMSYKILPSTSRYLALGESIPSLKDTPLTSIHNESDSNNYRAAVQSRNGAKASPNASLLTGTNGISTYFSLINAGTMQFVNDMNLADQQTQIRISGLDNRLFLESLFSVKYLGTDIAQPTNIPYGFTEQKTVKRSAPNDQVVTDRIYQNQYALPFGYTYSSVISQDAYEKLSPLEKQQAMMQGAILESGSDVDLPHTKIDNSLKEVPYTIQKADGVKVEKDKIVIEKSNASLNLSFTSAPNSETYVYLSNLEATNLHETPTDTTSLSKYQKLTSKINAFYTPPTTTETIHASGKRSTNRTIYSSNSKFYINPDHFLGNIGYSEEPQKSVKLTFSTPGEISYDDLKIISQPMDDYPEQVEALGSEALNVEVNNANYIRGTVDLSEDKMMAFSIPYSKGWTAYVDGKEQPLETVNTMFMGLQLDSGKHQIELKYETPGLKVGAIFTLVGLISLITLTVVSRRMRKRI
ncbi:YfhO family protein [Listeria costaricensis]|uniref:YfhO family protein n=1 Tax=Listeria costaricensis TaxID=2026604 RepID=UPI000C06E6C0|nr:YfhO family protein [Listeria costaricensis]